MADSELPVAGLLDEKIAEHADAFRAFEGRRIDEIGLVLGKGEIGEDALERGFLFGHTGRVVLVERSGEFSAEGVGGDIWRERRNSFLYFHSHCTVDCLRVATKRIKVAKR